MLVLEDEREERVKGDEREEGEKLKLINLLLVTLVIKKIFKKLWRWIEHRGVDVAFS